MYELPKRVQRHILPGKHSHCLSSSSILGAGSLYVVSSTIIKMVSRGVHIAGRSSFGIKLANPSDTMLSWSVPRLFLFKAFQRFLLTYPHTVLLETLIDNVKLNFFYLSVLWNCYAYTYSFFDNNFHTVCKKNPGHLFLCLSCKVFTFDHLFCHRSVFFISLTISLTKWTQYRKNRCLSSSTNSVHFHFRERVEKTKENAQKTKTENLQNGQEKYGGKKSRTCTFGEKI